MFTPMPYAPEIRVTRLYTLFYYHFASGYVFEGERHNFWEMVYVDRGEVEIGAGKRAYLLRAGDIIFHRPMEFHSIWAKHPTSPSLVVVSFSSPSKAMRAFRGRLSHVDAAQRHVLQQLISEAQHTFRAPLDEYQRPSPDAPAGGLQMIVNLLEQLLILLLRTGEKAEASAALCKTPMEIGELLPSVQQYMRAHLDGSVRFADICRHTGIGSTALKKLFQAQTGVSVMAYYERLRLSEACAMLREGRLNASEIADALGYSSPQYFSTRFRKVEGMTPSEYARSVRATDETS